MPLQCGGHSALLSAFFCCTFGTVLWVCFRALNSLQRVIWGGKGDPENPATRNQPNWVWGVGGGHRWVPLAPKRDMHRVRVADVSTLYLPDRFPFCVSNGVGDRRSCKPLTKAGCSWAEGLVLEPVEMPPWPHFGASLAGNTRIDKASTWAGYLRRCCGVELELGPRPMKCWLSFI